MLPLYDNDSLYGLKPTAFVDLFGGTGFTSMYYHARFPDMPIFLNELNKDIYEIYSQIKNNYDDFINRIDKLGNEYLALPLPKDNSSRKDFYLDIREDYHSRHPDNPDCTDPMSEADRASTLFFMLSTNFNGIWQAKSSTGVYYTPFGNGNQRNLYDKEMLMLFHSTLQKATLTNLSYEEVTGYPEGSFIFLDPPYIDSFTRYDSRSKFIVSMQEEVARWAVNASRKHTIAFCNKDHPMFRDIFKDFDIYEYDVTYTGGMKISKACEILVTNFVPEKIATLEEFC